MSASKGWQPRPRPALPRSHVLLPALLLPMITLLAQHAGSLADSSRSPVRLDPEQARRSGVSLELRAHPELPAATLEVRGGLPHGTPGSDPAALAASAGGEHVALAERPGQDPTTLVVAHADGGQVRVPFDGLLAASFAPDGSWVAVTDGIGRMWRVDSGSGEAELLADGPFAGPLLVEPDGAVLALAVPSVEAPFTSQLVRVDPADGATPILVDEELVYGMQPLAAADLAVIAHRPAGTVLLRLAGEATEAVADLGPGAVNVSASADLELIAWERDGEVVLHRAGAEEIQVAAARAPRVAADGSMIIVDLPAGSRALGPDGTTLADFDGPMLLLPCPGCAS
jgi:hypothetical protein